MSHDGNAIPEQHPDYVFAAMSEAHRDQPPIHFGGVQLQPFPGPTAECEPHPSGYGSNCDHKGSCPDA